MTWGILYGRSWAAFVFVCVLKVKSLRNSNSKYSTSGIRKANIVYLTKKLAVRQCNYVSILKSSDRKHTVLVYVYKKGFVKHFFILMSIFPLFS